MSYENNPSPLYFAYDQAIAHSESLGYQWDVEGVRLADRLFKEIGMTQQQVNTALYCHILRISIITNPRRYSWRNRFLMAFYWLGIVGRNIPRVR